MTAERKVQVPKVREERGVAGEDSGASSAEEVGTAFGGGLGVGEEGVVRMGRQVPG